MPRPGCGCYGRARSPLPSSCSWPVATARPRPRTGCSPRRSPRSWPCPAPWAGSWSSPSSRICWNAFPWPGSPWIASSSGRRSTPTRKPGGSPSTCCPRLPAPSPPRRTFCCSWGAFATPPASMWPSAKAFRRKAASACTAANCPCSSCSTSSPGISARWWTGMAGSGWGTWPPWPSWTGGFRLAAPSRNVPSGSTEPRPSRAS